MLLSFKPTTAVFRYIETQKTWSSKRHLDEMAWGSCALNIIIPPGRSATVIPILGTQKYATTQLQYWYCRFGT